MYPDLFNIPNGSYTFMIIIGLISAFTVFYFYLKRVGVNKNSIIDILITMLTSTIVGFISAILFQNLYNLIEDPSNFKFSFSMTFLGGLIGGVITFILMYRFYYRKNNESLLKEIFTIAPGSICLAHGFGRIGCFLAGCCYGIESDAWYALYFPIIDKKVIPTQLFEAIFLFILVTTFIIIAFTKRYFSFNMAIYLISYSIFRFLIEFIRGDHRGELTFGISPSQFWSIIMFTTGFVILVFIIKARKKEICLKN